MVDVPARAIRAEGLHRPIATRNTAGVALHGRRRGPGAVDARFIERCVRLWSNPGELVLTPFAGIGSELYQSVKLGRRAVGIELKPSYWRTSVDNLTRLEAELDEPSLFDDELV